jgi:hypothetical protein
MKTAFIEFSLILVHFSKEESAMRAIMVLYTAEPGTNSGHESTSAILSPLSRIVRVLRCIICLLALAALGKAQLLLHAEGGGPSMATRPATIYVRIGAANAVLSAHAGTCESLVW